MNNNRKKNVVEFNQSIQTLSTAKPPLQMHNFMPMPTSNVHGTRQEIEEAKQACFENQMKQNMQSFWRKRLIEIHEAPSDVRVEKKLPLARIKRVMKSDEQVKMISADTPVVFAHACEVFIMELTLRAWMHTEKNRRRTLQRNDVANAIRDEDLLHFLKDIVPMEVHQEAELSLANHHHGVYVPLPVRGTPMMPPDYPVNMLSMNQWEVAPRGRPVATDHPLAFPMNLWSSTSPSFFTRICEEMGQNSRFPPSAPNEHDAYHGSR